MTDSALISDRWNAPIVVQTRENGGVVINRGSRFIALNENELARLVKFARNEARLLPYPVGAAEVSV
jgi:hypothetical protein